MNNIPDIKLISKREIPILAGHPWIFSNGLELAPENLPVGCIVRVLNSENKVIGWGMYNSNSSIRVRMLSLNPDAQIDRTFFKNRLTKLREQKRSRLPKETTGYRWVYAESDFLPGLIVDQFGDTTVFQIHAAGMENQRENIVDILSEIGGLNIIERSDVGIRKDEGMTTFPVLAHKGVEADAEFLEYGIKFSANVMKGQKTGFFLDQREARILVGKHSKDKNVLNLFSYTGAFSVYAAMNGAKKVTSVDISQDALNGAMYHFSLNKIDPKKHEFMATDAFKFIDKEAKKNYDLIICDPPAFAKTAAQINVASEAYIRINKKCFEHLTTGGQLLTSSCSGRITATDFEKLIRTAATQAKKQVRIVRRLGQASCHTERLAFPEGQYLKTLLVEVLPES
jgi:23S rRNA (cytosine1962-C5)-methyltransferase